MKAIFIAMLAIMLAGCTHPTASESKPDIPAAIAFMKETYPQIQVEKIDKGTVGVIWESGAEDKFEELKARVKRDFGVNALITAIE